MPWTIWQRMTSETVWNSIAHGSSMIKTPAKPTPTAVQRRQPTASRRIGTDSATMNSGAEKEIAKASTSGMRGKA